MQQHVDYSAALVFAFRLDRDSLNDRRSALDLALKFQTAIVAYGSHKDITQQMA